MVKKRARFRYFGYASKYIKNSARIPAELIC